MEKTFKIALKLMPNEGRRHVTWLLQGPDSSTDYGWRDLAVITLACKGHGEHLFHPIRLERG